MKPTAVIQKYRKSIFLLLNVPLNLTNTQCLSPTPISVLCSLPVTGVLLIQRMYNLTICPYHLLDASVKFVCQKISQTILKIIF